MKDWLINEFYTFVEILHRRKAILILPCFGMIWFILLDAWMQHLLLEAANKTSKSIIDFTPIFVKNYEKMHRIAFFEIVCKINNYLETHFCFSWTLWHTYLSARVSFNLDNIFWKLYYFVTSFLSHRFTFQIKYLRSMNNTIQ